MKNNCVIILCLLLLIGCGNPEVSITVKNKNSGKILVNGELLQKLSKRIYNLSENDANYYIDLPKGKHDLQIFLESGEILEESFILESEAYLGVDLITGELKGLE